MNKILKQVNASVIFGKSVQSEPETKSQTAPICNNEN